MLVLKLVSSEPVTGSGLKIKKTKSKETRQFN